MIWGIQAQFPQIAPILEYWETGTTQPTEALETRVMSHLMRNKELKTLDYFTCVPARDLGYSGPVSPNCPNTRLPVKIAPIPDYL